MKIVYCIGALSKPGGTERVLVNKANYLADHLGQEVHVLIADQQDQPLCYDFSSKVIIHDMSIRKYLKSKKVIKGFTFLSMTSVLKLVYQRKINEIQPDVILVLELGYDDFIIPGIKSKAVKIREIHSSHNAQRTIKLKSGNYAKQFFLMKLYYYLANKYDAVVVLTHQDAKDRTYFKNKFVIPNCIEINSAIPQLHKSTKAISVGRLDKFKNFADQIIVWSSVIKKHPDWTLHIYGDGPERSNLEQLIVKLKLEKHVFLEGITNNVSEKYAASSLFIFTSVAEGFGMVLVEAMQMGVPVISYDCPCGPSDIITNGEDGFLIPLKGIEELEKKIITLIENDSLREKMGENAKLSSQRYKTNKIMPEWITLFNNLISKKNESYS